MLALCKLVDVSVCASQAAAKKAQPLWQQLGFQAKIYEKKCVFLATPTDECRVALRRPCYHLEMRRHMKYTPIIIKLRPREPANEVDSVR